MRHVIRGVLGAALVYPLVWHYSAPAAPAKAQGTHSTAAAGTARSAQAEGRGATADAQGVEQQAATRTVTEHLPENGGDPMQPVRPQAPIPPREPSVADPQDPLAELPELKEVLARVGEVQRHAADPSALEREVQTLDADPEKLERLKALADRFVKMPPPRGDIYLPSSGGPAASPAAR